MLSIKIYDLSGKLLFVGQVPEESVTFQRGYNRSTTASFSVPAKDLLSDLASGQPCCLHGRVIGEKRELMFAGAIYECPCCENVFGSFSPVPHSCPTCTEPVEQSSSRRECTCSMPTYYYSPEGAKGHCTCGAL